MLAKEEFIKQAEERKLEENDGSFTVRINPESLNIREQFDVCPVDPDYSFSFQDFNDKLYEAYKDICEEISELKYVGFADDCTAYGETEEEVIERLHKLDNAIDQSSYEIKVL